MRLICDERNRLCLEYREALDSYTHAVRAAAELAHSHALWKPVSEAHDVLESCRSAIRNHCLEHGCDPEWLKDFGEKPTLLW